MTLTSSSRERFDYDELASGAIKGWLLVTALTATWAILDPHSDVLGFMLFEGRLSLWLLIGALGLGLPCASILGRHWADVAAWRWGVTGAIIFALGFTLFAALFRTDVALGDLLVEFTLSSIFGGSTFYLAKRQSDVVRDERSGR